MSNELSVVGKRIPMLRWFASEKVTGKAKFTVDMKLPGMLHAKMVRSPYPHARILKVDTSKAEKLPGVKALVFMKSPDQFLFLRLELFAQNVQN